MLANFAINKQPPKNSYFTENLIRMRTDLECIKRLQTWKEYGLINSKETISASNYRRINGVLRQMKQMTKWSTQYPWMTFLILFTVANSIGYWFNNRKNK